jgi:hypothetical protein
MSKREMNGEAEKAVFDSAAAVDSCDEEDVVCPGWVQANAIHTPIYPFACTHHVIYSDALSRRVIQVSREPRWKQANKRRMSGVEACVGIGVQNSGWRNPPVQDGGKTCPTHLCALTTADQNATP